MIVSYNSCVPLNQFWAADTVKSEESVFSIRAILSVTEWKKKPLSPGRDKNVFECDSRGSWKERFLYLAILISAHLTSTDVTSLFQPETSTSRSARARSRVVMRIWRPFRQIWQVEEYSVVRWFMARASRYSTSAHLGESRSDGLGPTNEGSILFRFQRTLIVADQFDYRSVQLQRESPATSTTDEGTAPAGGKRQQNIGDVVSALKSRKHGREPELWTGHEMKRPWSIASADASGANAKPSSSRGLPVSVPCSECSGVISWWADRLSIYPISITCTRAVWKKTSLSANGPGPSVVPQPAGSAALGSFTGDFSNLAGAQHGPDNYCSILWLTKTMHSHPTN